MMDRHSITLCVIGSELLHGFKRDENGPYLIAKLNENGFPIERFIVVPDNRDFIERELGSIISAAGGVVILCGGLGPTEDDLTKQAVAGILKRNIIVDERLSADLERHLRGRGYSVTDQDLRQAEIIDGAEVIPNSVGLAPGLKIVEGDLHMYLLPGPPHELQAMFEDHVLDDLRAIETIPQHRFIRIRTAGLREARLAAIIEPVFHKNPMLSYAVLPSFRTIDVIIPYRLEDESKAQSAAHWIRSIIPTDIYTEDSRSIAAVVGDLLSVRDQRLSIAESCTGGLLGTLITDVPGSSRYFLGGVIAYSNEMKRVALQVDTNTLELYGAVSENTAKEMAIGVKTLTRADWGVAVTGIAGPEGGTDEKPVGTVFIGLAAPDESTFVQRHLLGGNRKAVRISSAHIALDTLRRTIAEVTDDA